jgi:hypothetical protein
MGEIRKQLYVFGYRKKARLYTQFVALSNVELTRDDDDDYGGRAQHYAYAFMCMSKQRA